MAMNQYLLIPFLEGWTSIYQLFLCSPGVQGFDPLPYIEQFHSVAPWISISSKNAVRAADGTGALRWARCVASIHRHVQPGAIAAAVLCWQSWRRICRWISLWCPFLEVNYGYIMLITNIMVIYGYVWLINLYNVILIVQYLSICTFSWKIVMTAIMVILQMKHLWDTLLNRSAVMCGDPYTCCCGDS